MLIALNKPYGVICQFSPHEKHRTLKDFVNVPNVYPAGRLDTDSEGLLLLTDDGKQQARITDPRNKIVLGAIGGFARCGQIGAFAATIGFG